MSYAQYLRNQASECVGAALETPKVDEAASLLDLAHDYHRVANVTEPVLEQGRLSRAADLPSPSSCCFDQLSLCLSG